MQNRKYQVCLLLIVLGVGTAFAHTHDGVANNTASMEKRAKAIVTDDAEPAQLHLGRYELYAGVPSMYLGHFILLPGGKYKVAFNTDEDNYDESGRYTFNKETNTIEWQSGMFRNNNWGGKITKTAKGFHIQFNKSTYGDSK